jgi:hypothetical protein
MNRVLEQGIDGAEQRAVRAEQQVAILAGQLRLKAGAPAAAVYDIHDKEEGKEDSALLILTGEICERAHTACAQVNTFV